MKKFILFLASLMLSVSLLAQKEVYYKSIKVNPRKLFEGEGLISSPNSEAPYYTFYYEGSDLTKIEFRRAGALAIDPYWNVATIEIIHGKKYLEYHCYDDFGKRCPNKYGVYVVKYLPNKEGFCKYWFSFNDEDEKIVDSNGVHVYGYEHDAKGNCVLTRFHDIYGKQIKNKDGYYLITISMMIKIG